MAGSVNKVILVGNLGRDPEVRTMQNGNKIVTLNIATSETWKDRQSGEKRERTEWHKVVIFAPPLADIAERFLKKGSSVYIEGQLQTRKWQDQNGQDRYSTEVVLQPFKGDLTLLGGPRDGNGNGGGQQGGYGGGYDQGGYGSGGQRSGGGGGGSTGWEPPPSDLDDEIPFLTSADDSHFFGRKAVI